MGEPEKIKHSLQLEEDIALAEKSWPIQRVGWGILFLFLIMAALGTCGTGILSSASQQQGNTTMEYERFARYGNAFELSFKMANVKEHSIIAIPQSYLEHMEIKTISPNPSQQVVEDGNHLFVFDGNGKMEVSFFLEPEKAGKMETHIMAGHSRFSFTQLIYP